MLVRETGWVVGRLWGGCGGAVEDGREGGCGRAPLPSHPTPTHRRLRSGEARLSSLFRGVCPFEKSLEYISDQIPVPVPPPPLDWKSSYSF